MSRKDLLQFRRGTTIEWTTADPILDAGEPGLDTTTGLIRVGDGTSHWSALTSLGATGPAGAAGATGATGPSGGPVPTGGTTGQIIRKTSATDFDVTWDRASFDYRGTGSPLGVVTPEYGGLIYVDTAGTLGAWRWRSTGTTNTSWVCIDGDTGWRNVTSDWITDSAGTVVSAAGQLLVRRTGLHVDLVGESLTPSAAGWQIRTMTGFQPRRSDTPVATWWPWDATASRPMGSWVGAAVGVLWHLGSGTWNTLAARVMLRGSWITPDAWPTSLPGTAA